MSSLHFKIKHPTHSLAQNKTKNTFITASRIFTPHTTRASSALISPVRKHEPIAHRVLLRFLNAQQRQLFRRAHVRDVLLEALCEDEVDLLERAPPRLGVEQVSAFHQRGVFSQG